MNIRICSIFVLLFFAFSYLYAKHPFYVDIENIHYNNQSKTFEITLRIFLDDVQHVLETNNSKADIYNINDTSKVRQFYYPYITKNLQLMVNQQAMLLDWIGYERDKGVIVFYLESKPIDHPITVAVKSSILCQYFDQSHIVEITINKQLKNSQLNCQSVFNAQF